MAISEFDTIPARGSRSWNKTDVAPIVSAQAWFLAERNCSAVCVGASARLRPFQFPHRRPIQIVDSAWTARRLSGETDPARKVSEPVYTSMGWTDGGHSLLGAANGGRQVSDLCDQLHASWLSCSLVSGIAPLHVSLPRRRLL